MQDNQARPEREQAGKSLSLPAKFRLRFTMKADWHVGSGTGRPGNVDSLVLRDADGLPYLPAKTIRGVWRDAAEQLAYGLDDGADGRWSKLVELIFGNQPALPGAPVHKAPNESLLKPAPAHYSSNLRGHIRNRIVEVARSKADLEAGEDKRKEKFKAYRQQLTRQLHAASVFVKPGVSIDPSTGQAKTDFLRFEEMGRKGAVLEGACFFVFDGLSEEMRPYAFALLLASAQFVERVGGKRRRGAGRCQMEIVKACSGDELSSTDEAVDWLEENSGKLSLPEREDSPCDEEAFGFTADAENDQWWIVPLVLKLKAPLAVTARTLGNISEALDYLPGTYLLPRVTQVLKEIGYDCHASVAGGDVQVLPATIEVNGGRGLPVPHALFRHKSGGGFDKSGTIFNRLSEEETAGKQLKGYREGYIGAYQGNQLPAHETTPKVLGTHNTVEDKAQRPKEEVGGVYSWEAIAAGTVLRSELRVRGNVKEDLDKRQAEWWLKLNSDDLRLGSSRKDDYGSVTLEAGQVAKFSPAPQAKGNKLTVWLLSDLLLREPSLRATTFIERLCEVLEDKLEVKLEEWKPGEGLLGSLLRARRVESWQVSWGLPRPSLLATQAGSCVVFKIKDELDGTGARQLEDKLKKLEREGVGERRAEGYGQVRFNDPLTTEEVNKWAVTQRGDDKDAAESQAVALTPAEEEIARRVETEVWREEMRRGILAFASDPEKRRENLGLTVKGGESYPPSTQLSGLRDVISHLRNEADKGGITAWLGHLKDTRNRREKWGGALKKIEGLIDEPNGVWELIDSDNTLKLTLSSEAERRLRRELWAEAVRGLIDACVRAQKRETE